MPQGQYPFGSIEHYYGDVVRQLFVVIAVLIGLGIPLSGAVQSGLAFGAPAIVVLVILAGLTTPHGRLISIADAVASACGVLAGEVYAVNAYGQEAYVLFALTEFICFLFLVSLYFSVKTVRAQYSHMIGRRGHSDEFENE
jgi:hypothetical protein